MRSLRVTRASKWVFLALLAAAVLCLPLVLPNYLMAVAINALLVAYVALTWNLAFGYAGALSLSQHVFYGIGAYVSTMLFLEAGISPWLGVWAGAVLAALVGVVFAIIVFRYGVSGVYLALVTMALGEVAKSLASSWELIGGTKGLWIQPATDLATFRFADRQPYYYILVGMVILMMLVTRIIEQSKLGAYLTAIREDETAAEAAGINTYWYKCLIMAISAALGAFGGTFYAQYMLYIEPNVLFDFGVMLNIMLATMVGGPGTVAGPVLGATVFGAIGELFRSLPFGSGLLASHQFASLTRMLYALALVFVVLFFPKGLAGIRISRFRPRRKPLEIAKDGTTEHEPAVTTRGA